MRGSQASAKRPSRAGRTLPKPVLRWLEPEYVGLDPAGPEAHWDRVYYVATRWRNGPALMTGLSAIDMALWDIEAKRLGVPLYALLGGPIRDKLRVYYTHWDAPIPPGKRDIATVTEMATRTREQGWTAIKYTLPPASTELERIDQDVAELAAIRKVFGNQVDIALECAETFTVRSAIQFANAIAPYRPLFHGRANTARKPSRAGRGRGKEPGSHCHRGRHFLPLRIQATARCQGRRDHPARRHACRRGNGAAQDRQHGGGLRSGGRAPSVQRPDRPHGLDGHHVGLPQFPDPRM